MKQSIIAATAILTLLGSAANATVFVYDGFDSSDYGTVAAASTAVLKDKGGDSTGFSSSSKWGKGESSKTGVVFVNNDPLSFPSTWDSATYPTGSYAAGLKNSGSSGGSDQRGLSRPLADDAFPTTGTFYFRILLRRQSGCSNAPTDFYRAAGFLPKSFTGYGDAYASGNSAKLLFSAGLWLGTRQDSDTEKIVLRLGSQTLVLLDGVQEGVTYLAVAKVEVDADGGNEVAHGFAVPVDSYAGPVWSESSVSADILSDTAPLTHFCIVGAYKTNNKFFTFDEAMVTDSLMTAVPVSELAIASSGASSVGLDSIDINYTLSSDSGADVYLDYGTSADDLSTTLSLGSKTTGAYSATMNGLAFDTDYFWRFRASSGSSSVTNDTATARTTGVPIFGAVTAAASGQTATFTVALAEAALENAVETSVAIAYGTSANNLSESVALGSSSSPTTLTGTATNLAWGTTYHYAAVATATSGVRTVSATSATGTFTILYDGDMFVAKGNAGAVPPYATPETAAPDIATAIAAATDGATIHVADGLYPIRNQLAIRNAIRLVGNDADPSRVLVSNTAAYNYNDSTHRCIAVNNADAWVSGFTFARGENGGNGGNVYIAANGGTVSNCIVTAGTAREHNQISYGSNVAIVGPGLLTHCRILGSTGNGTSNTDISSVCLQHAGSRVENCLVDGFTVPSNAKGGSGLYVVLGTAVNCTVVNCRTQAKSDDDKMRLFSGLRAGGNGAMFTNCVSALNTDGNGTLRAIRPDQSGKFFVNCAYDGIAGETTVLSGMVSPVVGTAASLFRDYANGDYRPASGGPLVGKGANYEGMAAVDLSGKQKRLIGRNVDIGCFEANDAFTLFLFQ